MPFDLASAIRPYGDLIVMAEIVVTFLIGMWAWAKALRARKR